jgi:hypothetical protein
MLKKCPTKQLSRPRERSPVFIKVIGAAAYFHVRNIKMTITPNELWPKLENDGEDAVRIKLAQGSYDHNKVRLVEEWLSSKERVRLLSSEERKESAIERQLDATERQATAAEIAASSALEQARIARTAKNIAITAMIIGIIIAIVNIIVTLFLSK